MPQALPSQSGKASVFGSNFSPQSQPAVPSNLSPHARAVAPRSINGPSIFRSSGKNPIPGINLPSASLTDQQVPFYGMNLPSSSIYDNDRKLENPRQVGRNIISPGQLLGQR